MISSLGISAILPIYRVTSSDNEFIDDWHTGNPVITLRFRIVLPLAALTQAVAISERPKPVDLELAFVVDASGSIDETKNHSSFALAILTKMFTEIAAAPDTAIEALR
ncbi:MAG: hypothetical protein ACPGQV_09350 [Alphaproteobacteria bacterium]